MSGDKFKVGDRVFARLKGYPPWPARVTERTNGKESYNVIFFGTYDVGIKLKPSDIYSYDDEAMRKKFGAPAKPKPGFLKALEEIEQNIEIGEHADLDPGPEALEPETKKTGGEEDSDDGELMIDEGTPPPVLEMEVKEPITKKRERRSTFSKKEEKKEPVPSPKPAVEIPEADSGPTPSKQPRRSIKTKRDSVSSIGGHTPTPTTPIAEPAASTPAVEVVSRSGRKIKPKRFADDEIETPTSKPEPKEPSKRKRAASNAAATTPKTPTAVLTPNKPEKKETTPVVPTPPLPTLEKPKLVAARTSTRRKDSQEGLPSTSTTPAPATKPNTPSSAGTLRPPPPLHPFGRRPSEKIQSPANPVIPELVKNSSITVTRVSRDEPEDIIEDETQKFDSNKGLDAKKPGVTITSLKPKDKPVEAFKLGSSLTITSVKVENQNGLSNQEKEITSSRPTKRKVEEQEKEQDKQHSEPDIKRMKVEMTNGSSVVLSVNHDKPKKFKSDNEKSEWDVAAANNMLQAKMEVETNGIDFLKKAANHIEEQEPDIKDMKSKQRSERIQKKITQLRMEGEIIEIIGEIIGCLSTSSADCDRSLELLERLAGHTVNTLALKKHPEVVDSIRKLTKYKGNTTAWKLSENALADFDKKSALIRDKAVCIYQSFKNLFCTMPGTSFYDVFHQEVEKFKQSVGDLNDHTVLGLYNDPSGVIEVNAKGDQEMCEA